MTLYKKTTVVGYVRYMLLNYILVILYHVVNSIDFMLILKYSY